MNDNVSLAISTEPKSAHWHLNINIRQNEDKNTNPYVLCRMKVHLLAVDNWQHPC